MNKTTDAPELFSVWTNLHDSKIPAHQYVKLRKDCLFLNKKVPITQAIRKHNLIIYAKYFAAVVLPTTTKKSVKIISIFIEQPE